MSFCFLSAASIPTLVIQYVTPMTRVRLYMTHASDHIEESGLDGRKDPGFSSIGRKDPGVSSIGRKGPGFSSIGRTDPVFSSIDRKVPGFSSMCVISLCFHQIQIEKCDRYPDSPAIGKIQENCSALREQTFQ
jgi:hypothetical protein